jgi:acyl carrier protein
MDPVEQTLRGYLRDNFLFADEADSRLGADDSFLELGVLDSQGVMELVGFVETTWRFTVPDHDLVPEHFDSLAGIRRYVEQRLGVTPD